MASDPDMTGPNSAKAAGTGVSRTDHFLALDGVRGLAAVAVLIFHLQFLFNDTRLFDGSFLAVDLFFVMSGLVVALSYDRRLLSGEMSLGRFVQVRMIRLLPLYLAGCALGALYQIGRIILESPEAPTLADLASTIPYVLLLLPVPNAADIGLADYPFTPTAWSLSLEFWFNIIYAIVVVRWRSHWLILLALASFVLLCFEAARWNTTDLGWGVITMAGGIARFWFSFTVGVLLFRWIKHAPRLGPWWMLIIPATFLFIFIPRHVIVLQLFWIAIVFPAFVFAAARLEVKGVMAKASDHLGRLSYGVYILHGPVVLLALGAAKAVLGDQWERWDWAIGIAIIPAVFIATAVLTYYFEEPVRRRLRHRKPGVAPKAAVDGSSRA